MNDTNSDIDRTGDDVFTYEVCDEAVEAAARTVWQGPTMEHYTVTAFCC